MPRRPGEKFIQIRRQEEKRKRDRAYDGKRGTSAQRGYDARWERIRLMKLRENPLCEICDGNGIITEATEVHHIVPIGDGGEIYAIRNLMSLCHSCHMKIHASGGGAPPISGTSVSETGVAAARDLSQVRVGGYRDEAWASKKTNSAQKT